MTINYMGAGILIATKDHHGLWHILLGTRLFKPGKGRWSIPGGAREGERHRLPFHLKYKKYNKESMPQAAVREMNEELRLWNGAQRPPAKLPVVFNIMLPFFSWKTYLWIVDNPQLLAANNGITREFGELAWFRPSQLPKPLFFGMRSALFFARSHGVN